MPTPPGSRKPAPKRRSRKKTAPPLPPRNTPFYKNYTMRAKKQAAKKHKRKVSVQELKDRLQQSMAPPRKNPPKFAPVAMINNLNRNYVADDLENLENNQQMNAVLGSPILFSEPEWVKKYFGGRRKTRRKLKRKKRKTIKSKNKRKTRRRKGRKNKRKSRRRRR